ncbi:hypothetical protein [Acetobacter senegalensis]|uniref:hypothetical protein n=1 Tax=Acetobacter senegalensis TaxID=446692 RepID=UPI002653E855|nr:hypothetical protein [Acetobacter senegalensis]MDN7355485.1 hypothetical protein [Acetobacter senegalensis]
MNTQASFSKPEPLSSRNWFPKVSAAVVAGGLLTFGIMGVVGLLCHSDASPRTLSAQFLLWLVALVWCVLLSVCFLFRSGRQAWVVLAGANVLVWGLFFAIRGLVS